MRVISTILILMAGLGPASVAQAARIRVDLRSQTMHVSSEQGDFDWPISSARDGYVTPRGNYGVQRLEAMHYSRKYHDSPMPHSIFFRGGYAIHGTYATASLGAPASHGCIRLAPENAALLYDIVQAEGARISITGSASDTRAARVGERRAHYDDAAGRPAFGDAVQPAYAPDGDDWASDPADDGQPGAQYDPNPD